jgi:GWxTD domain-containing protein
MKRLFSYALLFCVAMAACTTTPRTSSKTLNNNYKRDGSTIHPTFTLFNVNDSMSEVHFKISSKELLYMRADGTNFSSNLLISYLLLPSYDSKEIIDSASVRLVDINNDNADKFLVGKMNVKARAPRSYFVKVKVADLNRGIDVSNVLALEKDSDLGRQNFLVRVKETDMPLFSNYVRLNEPLSISYKSKISVNVFVRFYNRDFNLAPPPFSVADPKPFQYKPDSTFTLELKNGVLDFAANKKGFYHFQLDTSKRDGLTLFHHSDNFPEIRKADEMVPPLRYITSKEEFTELTSSTNKKLAVEKFWINCTGNTDRAKEVIRKYYNRVQDANRYFSSYLEGWKTDRGMVYLIYGAPNVIYRTANSETWIYGEENNLNSVQYLFSKVNNPFTDNDYGLERSAMYKQSWYVAVDIWRQGRTYLQD